MSSSAPKASFAHVILTRFNVRWDEPPTGPSRGTNPQWLERRFELFERYCLPSMLNQSRGDFHWLIFFDHETPEPFASRARALARSEGPRITPVFTGPLQNDGFGAIIAERLPATPDWLLTTRLDNDDGLHRDFVAAVQDAQRFARAEVLNCPTGVILSGSRAYRQRHLSNAFISLSEPFEARRTVLSITFHPYASDFYPVRQVRGGPLWLQVIHDGNVSNRVRGRRVRLASVADGFPPLESLAKLSEPEPLGAILMENLTVSAARTARDLAFAGARRGAKLLGLDLRRRARPGQVGEHASTS
jgi:hypothetical protein